MSDESSTARTIRLIREDEAAKIIAFLEAEGYRISAREVAHRFGPRDVPTEAEAPSHD